jgi:hypothetical protein
MLRFSNHLTPHVLLHVDETELIFTIGYFRKTNHDSHLYYGNIAKLNTNVNWTSTSQNISITRSDRTAPYTGKHTEGNHEGGFVTLLRK